METKNEKESKIDGFEYWNYRVLKDYYEDGSPLFKFIEVYYNKNNEIVAWCDVSTGDSTALLWDNLKDLKETLKHLINDVENPILIRKEKESDELMEGQ